MPTAPHRRINLRDIAEAAGCHFSTVSLALRNHPRLPRATCERVQAVARELGYVPDPMLTSLANYRNGLRPVAYQATLAWVTNYPTQTGWRAAPIFEDYFLSASERATGLGYKLEEFWLRERGMTPMRATQILRARKITGLLFAPQPAPGTQIELDWAQFSAVSIGFSLISPRLHLVCPHQYRAARLAMQELARRGYRRPGLVMLKASDERVDQNWSAGFRVEQQTLAARDRLEPLFQDEWDEAGFTAWLRRVKPDVVVTKFPEVQAALRRWERAGGRETGAVYLTCTEPGGERAGVYENPREVGAAAIDYLSGMIQRNERGVPTVPQRLLIESSWVEGRTVRGLARANAVAKSGPVVGAGAQ